MRKHFNKEQSIEMMVDNINETVVPLRTVEEKIKRGI
jgi:hypothetical protein